MAMQIHGNYDLSGTDYAERVKEKQAANRAEKAKEAEKAAEGKTVQFTGKYKKRQINYKIKLCTIGNSENVILHG